MLNKNGVPSIKQLMSKFPKKELLNKAKAITECYEEIPCNPCSTSCPFNAITIGSDINKPPVVDFDKCTGCAICVYNCPGLAIFTIQIENDKARFRIPYEFLPLPDAAKKYQGLNREGEFICEAFVEKVVVSKRQDKTALVTVLVDVKYIDQFVTIGGRI